MAAAALAGPLDPPVGPVAPSNKTLQEVEPRIAVNAVNTPGDNDATPSLYKITQPGSYYLTGNITGVNGKRGIEIVASGVTLDLNGFDVVGVPGTFDGIQVTDIGYTNITIKNGSVRNWVGNGVNLGTSNAQNCAVIDVRSSSNSQFGFRVGNATTVRGCTAYGNIGAGILTGSGCVVSECVAYGTANGTGISAGATCTITKCSAYFNVGIGISTGVGCTIAGCSVSTSSQAGIFAGEGSMVSGCGVSTNGASGISTGNGCTIEACSAASNQVGISATTGCRVSNCTARSNTGDGIAVTQDCTVTGNTCVGNGTSGGTASGIHATGTGNRIDGNTASGGPRGIDVTGTNNVIVRNTCRANTGLNFNIVAANIYGGIIDRSAASGSAMSGNAATSTMASADPWANFTH